MSANNAIEIPIDPNQDESDSSYGDDAAISTASLSSSIQEYRELHGRTYPNAKTTEYWGPNDNTQNDQLDIVLALYVDDTARQQALLSTDWSQPPGMAPRGPVIDVGTGTGIWAIDLADEFPSAEVIGTDLSPIQPTFVPPNCKFEIDDAQLEWTYEPDSFDFVHLRCLLGCIKDWPALYHQAFKCLKPGGWIQHLDLSIEMKSDDGSITNDHIMAQWSKVFLEAGEKMGRTLRIFNYAKEYISDAGFVDIKETKYKLPIGGWSSDPKMKDIGRWNLLQFTQGVEGFALFLLKDVLKWEYTEIQAFVGKMRSALRDRRNHAYYEAVVVYGRKPERK